MKQGKTVLIENPYGMTPRVEIGTDNKAVWVDFGSMAVRISMDLDGNVRAVCEGRRAGEYGSEDATPVISDDGVVTWAWPWLGVDEEE